MDMSALYREDATEEEVIEVYQHLINTGQAWMMEGHVGRTADRMLEDGICILGEVGHTDYYGTPIPSRYQVKPGTKGSFDYAKERHPELWPEKCVGCLDKNGPSHEGSARCESGSIASGGNSSHCSCDTCF